MAEKALQINFKYNVPAEALMEGTAKSAEEIAAKPGLRWKIWIYNDDTKEAGGLYLFEDDASADAYIEWVTEALENNPAASDVTVKKFDINEDATALTRGPVAARVAT
jgi:hypothetical protein